VRHVSRKAGIRKLNKSKMYLYPLLEVPMLECELLKSNTTIIIDGLSRKTNHMKLVPLLGSRGRCPQGAVTDQFPM
jgi:hypothetical protein